jgi:hypothetical protein
MRQIRIILTIAAVLLCCLTFVSSTATAQTITGYTSIDYYEATNTIHAYSETDEDYEVQALYGVTVSLNVVDQNQTLCGYATASDNGTAGYAAVEVVFSGTPASTYTAMGVHKALAQAWDYDYSDYPYVHMVWYDYYNFSDFATYGIQTPIFYNFISTGPEVTRPTQPILLGGTHDDASVTTPVDRVIFKTAKIYQGDQATFSDEGGVQAAHLTATTSQCNPYSNFTLTVKYNLPDQTREIYQVTAKGFGNTSVSEWYVDPTTINHNEFPSRSPPDGTVSMTVNNKNGGITGSPPYDEVQVTVKGKYNSGSGFSTTGAVHIQCP